MMSADRPCLVALAERAELIREHEICRTRWLRDDAQLQALAEQVSASVVSALLRPIGAYLALHEDGGEAEQLVRRIFGLPDALAPDSRDMRADLAA